MYGHTLVKSLLTAFKLHTTQVETVMRWYKDGEIYRHEQPVVNNIHLLKFLNMKMNK